MAFKKATKEQAKLRLALEGPAGSGKTFTALQVGTALGQKVACIDTEHGSASKYADRFSFDSVEPGEFSLQTYLRHIREAAEGGYDVLVVDSLSHAWSGKGGALEMVDRLGAAAKGNKFTGGWSQVTPLQNQLIDALLGYPGHVIVTMRTKTEYVLEDRGGKQVPRKVGLAPVQRDGVEYEFDVIAELTVDGTVTISKTRCPALSGNAGLMKYEDVPAMAKTLKSWLADGVAPVPRPVQPSAPAMTPPPSHGEPGEEEKLAIAIREAQSPKDLDALVKSIEKLPQDARVRLRVPFKARYSELSAGGAA